MASWRLAAKWHFLLLLAFLSSPRVGRSQTPELVVQTGHAVGVTALAFSPDGTMLVSGSHDRSIIVWDVATGRQLRTLVGHEEPVSALAFGADGGLLSASWDGTVRRWDPHTTSGGEVVLSSEEAITFMLPGETGSAIGFSGFDDRLTIWDNRAGVEKKTPVEGDVRGGHDGAVVLVRGDTVTVVIDVDTQKALHSTSTIVGPGPVAVSPAQRLAAHRGEWPNVDVIDLEGVEPLRSLAGSGVAALAFGAAGSRLAVAQGSGHVIVHETATGDTLWSSPACLDPDLRCWAEYLAMSEDGELLAAGFRSGEISLWDARTGERKAALVSSTSIVRSVSFGPSSSVLGSVADDGFLRVFDFRQVSEQVPIAQYDEGTIGVSLRPNGRDVVVGLGNVYTPAGRRIRSLPPGQHEVAADSAYAGETEPVLKSEYSPDGRRIAGIMDGWLYVAHADSTEAGRVVDVPGSPIQHLAFVPPGDRIVTINRASEIHLTSVDSGTSTRIGAIDTTLVAGARWINDVDVSPGGRLLALGSSSPILAVWSLEEQRLLWSIKTDDQYIQTVAFSPDGSELATAGFDGSINVWDAGTGEPIQELIGHATWVSDVEYSPDGSFLVSASGDTRIRYWRRVTPGGVDGPFESAATLVGFRDGSWVVVDEDGRFDGSNGGDIDGLHWVVGNEVIALGQLKDRYYDPGLMQKITGSLSEPVRNVAAIAGEAIELWPEVLVSDPNDEDGRLTIDLVDRGGGVGRVVVRINGKEAVADARSRGVGESTDGKISVDLAGSPYLLPGEENEVEIVVYNAEGYLHSRGVKKKYSAQEDVELPPISLWALVVGVSDYRGDDLDLLFAARDAKDFANALTLGADKLFSGRVHLSLLTSDADTRSATRENIVGALEAMRESSPADVIVVYFAGHGIVHGGPDGDFHYLTQDAATGDLTDPVVRQATTVSGDELNQMLGRAPALKQALILDTCHSGGIVASLADRRSLPPSRRLALERMKDRNSVFVLAGSAADAVSYEASRYGQGLLTYSLLMGMKGASLRDGEFVDVARLFDFARDNVPQLARGIGGIQDPVVAVPRGGSSFDIGELTADDREHIPLANARPLILRAAFQDRDLFDDHLKLTQSVNASLRAAARGTDPDIYFVDAAEFQDGYRIAGQYSVSEGSVKVIARVFRGRAEFVGEVVVQGSGEDIPQLGRQIVERVTEQLF